MCPAPDPTAALFHLAMPDDWAAAREAGSYPMSTRGRTLAEEGFVHCAFDHQVRGVADRFYADVEVLVVLRLDPVRLGAEVRVEPPAPGIEERFPHLYGPIPLDAVTAATTWRRDDRGWGDPPGGAATS